jgi:hypothetical protein
VFHKVGERRYKFFLLAGHIAPPISQRLLRHYRKIKASEESLSQRMPVSLDICRAFDCPENFDNAIDGTLKLLLRALGSSAPGKREEQPYNQPEI